MSLAVVSQKEYIKIKAPDFFDIGQVFDCGQCFRFEPVLNSAHEKEFSGVAFGRFVSFAQDGGELYIYGADERDFDNIWRGYLALDVDYAEIRRSIAEHCNSDVMLEAMEAGRGIRILRQEPYETVISFIISQNNNIPRIKKIIEALSASCGERIAVSRELALHASESCSLCAFPTAEALKKLGRDGLFALRTGFRAGYIYDAAERLCDGRLSLDGMSVDGYADCVKALCEVKGIGPKVASCIALFGLEKYDAFPVDVWIRRVMEKYFPDAPKDFSPVGLFGEYAGIAQQYLFYYERYKN